MTIYASAVIVAGGMGTRLGKPQPKAFVELAGRPLFTWALETLAKHPSVSDIVIVVPAGYELETRTAAVPYVNNSSLTIIAGGKERWQSVANGVRACSPDSEWVLVHDSARPFVSLQVISDTLALSRRFRCGITATQEIDTVRYYESDRCAGALDRSKIIRVGTPQLFHIKTLLEGFAHAEHMAPPPTDEAMLFESMGYDVGFSFGDPLNFKVTTPGDFFIAEAVMKERERSNKSRSNDTSTR